MGSTTSAARTVLVYREFLLPASETFILSQTQSLKRFRPLLVGRRRVEGLELGALRCELINNGGRRGRTRELTHRAGLVVPKFAERLSVEKPLLVHAHFGPDALNALPLSRRLALPLIVTIHGYDASRRVSLSDGFLQWRYGRRLPLLMREASLVLAVSDDVRGRLLKLGFPGAKIRTHYIGVDTERFALAPRHGREPIVLAVGRFVEKKGFGDLIGAMSKVSRSVPEARLVLIGAGPLEGELRAIAKRAGLPNIEWTGPLGPSGVMRWMRRARLLAVPSVTTPSGDREGLPTALIEGMASGLPVVGTRHAGIPEAISDEVNGMLVDEHDVDGLAHALRRMLQDDDAWDRFSTAGRHCVEDRFDVTRQTDVLERIYEEVTACAG